VKRILTKGRDVKKFGEGFRTVTGLPAGHMGIEQRESARPRLRAWKAARSGGRPFGSAK
jgi:hypothetical protein